MRYLLSFFLLCVSGFLIAQETGNVTISGYVYDKNSGESMIGVNVFLPDQPSIGTTTNAYGFYSLTLPAKQYLISFSYLGYQTHTDTIKLEANKQHNVVMSEGLNIKEVVVLAKKDERDENVKSTSMGRVTLPIELIKAMPALMGEVDILKSIQLLPGVSSAGEGASGFFVRGGGVDQNLVLLDEAIVYNSGHLFGFFSVFNSDAIKNTTLIKGGIPASYGGRLSSVLDIQMKEGNVHDYAAEGGIGLISSRLTVEGPIVNEKASFLISGRRTYGFDLAQPFIKNTEFAGTNYFFYDLNAKINYRFSQKDRLFLSGYFGRDVLNFEQRNRDFQLRFPYGNSTATIRWNHLFSDQLFFNLSAIYNDYKLNATFRQDDFGFTLNSGVRDIGAKFDFDYFPSPYHQFKGGLHITHHQLTPSTVNGSSGTTEFISEARPQLAMEYALYVQDDWRISNALRINLGVRLTAFQQLGPYTSKINGRVYGKGETVTVYSGVEPRAFGTYTINENTSLKIGVNSTTQYLHLVSNSASTLPTDLWVPSTEWLKPQRGWQYAAGYFRNFSNNMFETSVEVYYKQLQNQIDYREGYSNNTSDDLESEFVFGKGQAYGLELFVRKTRGRLSGWVGYTLSRSTRSFPDIENGRTFPTTYDRTHDISIVANYELSRKFTAGAVFIYATGRTYTPLERFYLIEGDLVSDYGPRNSQRLEPYHRMDISLTYRPKPDSQKRFKSEFVLSVYNAYNRLNTFFLYTDYESNLNTGEATATAYKAAIFPIIPSVTWNFKWK